jgi:peptidoglycan hydrolase CwlO-like protein
MDLLDNIEEYKKLINNVDNHFSSNIVKKDDLELKLSEANKSVEELKNQLSKVQNDLESKTMKLNALFESKLLDSNKEVLRQFNEYRQNIEEYKKITNDRIEKLVKLFLSINK